MAEDSIAIRFLGDVSSLEVNMKRGAKSVKVFSKNAQQDLRKLSGAIGKLTAVAGVAATGISVLTNNSAQAAAELRAMAQMSNTSTTSFQRLAAGAKSVFIEQDKLADILKDVNDRVGEFITTGGGQMKDFFEEIAPKIGVTIDQFRKLSGPEALQFYYNSLQAANLSQQEMTFFLEAMASDATKLIPLLKNNGSEFKRLGDSAEKAGRILDELEVESLTDSKKAFDEIGASVTSLQDNIASTLNPEIQSFKERVIAVTTSLNNMLDRFKQFRAESEKQSKIDDLTQGERGTRGRRRGGSQEAKEINSLISERIKLEEILNEKFVKRGGRSAKNNDDQKLIFEQRKTSAQEELDIINQRIEALQRENEAAKKVFEIRSGIETDPVRKSDTKKAGGASTTVTPGEFEVDGDPFNDEFYNRQQERIKILMESLDESKVVEEEYLLARSDLHDAWHNGQFESKAQYDAQMKELEARHQSDLTRLVQSGVKSRDNFEKLSFKNKTQFVLGQMQSLTQGIAQHSRKAFEINKAAGIANAIVNTAQGVTQALSAYPPPISFVMAAAQAAAGFAQINAIRNSSFRGGGAGVAPSQAADPATKVAESGGGGGSSSSGPSRTIYVQGISENSQHQGRQIIELINEAQADGATLVLG